MCSSFTFFELLRDTSLDFVVVDVLDLLLSDCTAVGDLSLYPYSLRILSALLSPVALVLLSDCVALLDVVVFLPHLQLVALFVVLLLLSLVLAALRSVLSTML